MQRQKVPVAAPRRADQELLGAESHTRLASSYGRWVVPSVEFSLAYAGLGPSLCRSAGFGWVAVRLADSGGRCGPYLWRDLFEGAYSRCRCRIDSRFFSSLVVFVFSLGWLKFVLVVVLASADPTIVACSRSRKFQRSGRLFPRRGAGSPGPREAIAALTEASPC